MHERKPRRSIALFLGALVLADVANLLDQSRYRTPGAWLSIYNCLAYFGLLLFRIQSVRAQSRGPAFAARKWMFDGIIMDNH